MSRPLTSLSHPDQARSLRLWLLFAVSALGVAGGFAFLAVLARTPAVQILRSAEGLHRAIAGHVTFSLLVWLLAFEAVLWLLAGSRAMSEWIPRSGVTLAAGGSILLIIAVVWGRGLPVLTDYVAVIVDPLFFLGLAAVVAGAGLAGWVCLNRSTARSGVLQRGMWHAAAALGLALAACLVVFLRLWMTGGVQADFAFFQSLFWIPGHLLQFVNVIAMVSVWNLLLEYGFGIAPTAGRVVRGAFTLYLVLAGCLVVATLPADLRTLPSNQRLSIAMGIALAFPTVIHMGIVVRGLIRGRWRWTALPEAAALCCSLSLFAGGVLLALARAGAGSSMWIPAHYHAVVVGGVTIAFMGLTYRLLAETGEIAWPRLAALQPWMYGVGMLLMVIGMNWAGSFGAPRKTFDPALGAAAARWMTPMNLMGLGGVVAVLGGATFVLNGLWSLLLVPRRASIPVQPAAFEAVSASRGTS